MSQANASATEPPMFYGVKSIAAFLGIRPRQALHMIEAGRLPHFRVGRALCASRSSLLAWLAEMERKASTPESA